MTWGEIKKLDTRLIESVWMEARAELLYEAFIKSRNLTEWAHYLEENPPSPETLAIVLVLGLEKYESTKGRDAARKRHAPTKEAKAFVVAEWSKHKSAYENNKSEFARHYAAIVRRNYTDARGDPLDVKEKTIRELWLRDPPSAGM